MDDVEARFIAMLREQPADDETRLIYADWLEAEGHHELADYIRTVLRFTPAVHKKKAVVLRERLVKLAVVSDSMWRSAVSKPPIEKCTLELRFKCPKQWSALTPTKQPKVRHCSACDRDVYYCASAEEVRERGRNGDCVAFDPALRDGSRVYDDAQGRGDMMMEIGEVARD